MIEVHPWAVALAIRAWGIFMQRGVFGPWDKFVEPANGPTVMYFRTGWFPVRLA